MDDWEPISNAEGRRIMPWLQKKTRLALIAEMRAWVRDEGGEPGITLAIYKIDIEAKLDAMEEESDESTC